MTKVRYMAVARIADGTAVVEHSFDTSEELTKDMFDSKLAKVLSSGRLDQHGRLTITDKQVGSIHYDSDPACLYLLITALDYPQRVAFRVLSEFRSEFEARFGDDFNNAKAGGLTKKTKEMCTEIAEKFENAGQTDKIASVSLQVEEVKGAMQQNINAVLKNQENLETLLESSNDMRTDAATFQRSAVQAKNRMWWKNVKLMIAIALVLAIILLSFAVPLLVKNSNKTGAAGTTG